MKNRIRPLEPLKIFELLPAWPCSWKFLDSCDRPGPSASNLHAISKEPRGRTNPQPARSALQKARNASEAWNDRVIDELDELRLRGLVALMRPLQ